MNKDILYHLQQATQLTKESKVFDREDVYTIFDELYQLQSTLLPKNKDSIIPDYSTIFKHLHPQPLIYWKDPRVYLRHWYCTSVIRYSAEQCLLNRPGASDGMWIILRTNYPYKQLWVQYSQSIERGSEPLPNSYALDKAICWLELDSYRGQRERHVSTTAETCQILRRVLQLPPTITNKELVHSLVPTDIYTERFAKRSKRINPLVVER